MTTFFEFKQIYGAFFPASAHNVEQIQRGGHADFNSPDQFFEFMRVIVILFLFQVFKNESIKLLNI